MSTLWQLKLLEWQSEDEFGHVVTCCFTYQLSYCKEHSAYKYSAYYKYTHANASDIYLSADTLDEAKTEVEQLHHNLIGIFLKSGSIVITIALKERTIPSRFSGIIDRLSSIGFKGSPSLMTTIINCNDDEDVVEPAVLFPEQEIRKEFISIEEFLCFAEEHGFNHKMKYL